MLKNKKAYIWVSTVIYIALGMIVITIILTAGMPVINNLRDKNIALQTKDVMHEIDKSIRAVLRDGPGAQRVRDFDIGRGFIEIIPNEDEEKIKWEIETGVVLSAIDHEVQEGNLKILTEKTLVEKEYKTTIWLDYTKPTPLTNIEGDSPLKLSGKFTLVIRNTGTATTINEISIPDVSIKEKL